MSFYIVRVVPGTDPVPVSEAGEFALSQDAAKAAKDFTAKTGVKHQPRRMAQADTEAWKERERQRIQNKAYPPLPKGWQALAVPADHFLHISPKNKAMVAYFPDANAGVLDRPVETTPGRYLGQFTTYDTTGEEAKRLIAEIDALVGVQFAWSREDFKRIYENGPSSCMHKSAESFGYGGIHPAEMYAAGDLALAHFWDEKAKKATARAVCWPEKKLYGVIYGDYARLEKGLKDLGYTSVSDGRNKGTFPAGVRFHKLEHPGQKGHYVAPYLDNFNCSLLDEGEVAVTLDREFDLRKAPKGKRILSRGQYGMWVASRVCPKLGNPQPDVPDNKWTFINGADEEWSPAAVQAHAFRCGHTKAYWPREDKYRAVIGGVEYSKKAADELGTFTCSVTKMMYLKSDLHAEEDGAMVSKAGHTHRERVKRIHAERERERKRLADERKRWQEEMDLVAKTVEPLAGEVGERSTALNHYVVLDGAKRRTRKAENVWIGNSHIADAHEAHEQI